MSNDSPKSAVELAMERLRKKDAEGGVVQQTLTDEQKAAIAEVRSVYQAKLAHAEVMHKAALMNVGDPTPHATLEEQYQRDRERFISEREAAIARIRAGSS
jgi:hypothetical protein